MNLEQILQALQLFSQILGQLQALGVNVSGVQIHTPTPIDLSQLLVKH
jgi:hypothetical protein